MDEEKRKKKSSCRGSIWLQCLHLSGCLESFSHQSKALRLKLRWDTVSILRGVVARAMIWKYSRLGSLHNRSVFSCSFGGGEVWDGSIGRICSFWGLSPWLADGSLSLSSRGLPSVPVCVLISSSHDTGYIGLEPPSPHSDLILTSLSLRSVSFLLQ